MKYIFFDLDGTLTDPAVGITTSVKYALDKMGRPTGDISEYNRFIGPPLRNSFREWYGMSAEEAEQAVAYYREYFSPTGIFQNRVYDGIPEALSRLIGDGYGIALATSKPEVFARRILERFDLEKYFDFIGGSTLDGTREEKWEVVKFVLDETGCAARDVIMVGDRENDIIGAKKNGVRSLGVLYGYGTREELVSAGADAVCESVEKLYDAIKELDRQ